MLGCFPLLTSTPSSSRDEVEGGEDGDDGDWTPAVRPDPVLRLSHPVVQHWWCLCRFSHQQPPHHAVVPVFRPHCPPLLAVLRFERQIYSPT